MLAGQTRDEKQSPYQRFVKTTPNPSATKKSNGELVGPLALPAGLVVGPAKADVVREGAEVLDVGAVECYQDQHIVFSHWEK